MNVEETIKTDVEKIKTDIVQARSQIGELKQMYELQSAPDYNLSGDKIPIDRLNLTRDLTDLFDKIIKDAAVFKTILSATNSWDANQDIVKEFTTDYRDLLSEFKDINAKLLEIEKKIWADRIDSKISIFLNNH